MESKAYAKDRLTQEIIACILRVHWGLGPGFLEDVYRRALMIELELSGIEAVTESRVEVVYKDQEVGKHRLDILVENKVVIELKAVEHLTASHYAQVRSYLRAACLHQGLLVNFSKQKVDFRRIDV